MTSVEIRDSRRPARVTLSWERLPGFQSPLVRVSLHYDEELHVSARIRPGLHKSLVRFLENLASLEKEGTWERREFQSTQGEFGITSYLARVCGGEREIWVVRCEFSLASDWDNQYWVVQLMVDIEFAQLTALISQMREFFASQSPEDLND